MDIFTYRDQLISDYSDYIRSFISIQDGAINNCVQDSLKNGEFWPESLIQLNPAFKPGATIDELVDQKVLHAECRHIFRRNKDASPLHGDGSTLHLHKHQEDAIHTAQSGHHYVLTTGTGSGKSLAYIVPIVDHVLKRGSGRGIQAIVVYPMNALANSQVNELGKFLVHGYPEGQPPVRYARYTGQESDETRNEIMRNPPDIILTNYVMLELILTRTNEVPLITAAQGLRFLVLDELHTYRGRQGADVALLVRRVRERLHADKMQCVGTSATLAGGGTWDEQRTDVARVASQLFGAEVAPQNVIGETLRRATPYRSTDDPQFVQALRERIEHVDHKPSTEYEAFISDPLSGWIESTVGVQPDPHTAGDTRLIRAKPRSILGADGMAHELSCLTNVPEERCADAIRAGLLGGYSCQKDPQTGFTPFAFRLHQFISRGDTAYASPESEDTRYITLNAQQYVPGDRNRVLLPMAFCRECGQEYYTVWMSDVDQAGQRVFTPRNVNDTNGEADASAGFLYRNSSNPWPDDAATAQGRYPDDWIEETSAGKRVRRNRRTQVPVPVFVGADGCEQGDGVLFHYMPTPLRFCLNCGVAYGSRQTSDYAKLATLSSGGRSTATTILSLSAIRSLRGSDLPESARKLLSFTDDRQDASLQAGHFNDFVEVGVLRAALYKAVADAGSRGLQDDRLTNEVFKAMALPIALYAVDPIVRFSAKEETNKSLRDVIGYRLYRDLKRGWRVTAPNLEQCGLLEIHYQSLDELCSTPDVWAGCHIALVNASPLDRHKIAKVLLDFMRRSLAIKVDYLDQPRQEEIKRASAQRLILPWSIDENETMEHAAILFPRPMNSDEDYGGNVFLSARGGFGQYLRRQTTFAGSTAHLELDDTDTIIRQLLEVLRVAGLVEVVIEPRDKNDVPGYQLPASALLWQAGDGTRAFSDPISIPREPAQGRRTNQFFVKYYRNIALTLQGIEAHEHTAQVPAADREEREKRFRTGKLPVLYCSPTMELGVDIADLNVVNMRNVPPTPANYAQRSGRAGRSGQPALVFTYCTTGSPHDQYHFRRPERMVSGAVATPRLDLANEELVRAHVHAVWLAETGAHLGSSLKDVLDVSGESPTLDLLPSIKADINSDSARQRAHHRAQDILDTLQQDLRDAGWYSPRWLYEVLGQVVAQFDKACDRWRDLYRSAMAQAIAQNRIILNAAATSEDRAQAERLRREAESQLHLLTDVDNIGQSDFYSYRYFAGEGFLPGYSFPRLPISAFIPARRNRSHDEFLSRPRFLAISEFGPRAIVYHEGSRYVIDKVILPMDLVANEGRTIDTQQVKRCESCGYLHQFSEGDGPDRCDRCHEPMRHPIRSLLRLQNVSTRRRDKISSDEEERLRQGYDLITSMRFTEHGGSMSCRMATVELENSKLLSLAYGDGATLWRINQGRLRRSNPDVKGFVLDIERGYWAREADEVDDVDEPNAHRTLRVIPYVSDQRNALLFQIDDTRLVVDPQHPTPDPQRLYASLQAALKSAIQTVYQLEDNELSAEPLPTPDDRRLILFYESAEGGAGVLRRLVDDPNALAEVARQALSICHYDPDTGEDLHHAPHAKEGCEAACYDCLMSYYNQREHALLDRRLIRDVLLKMISARVLPSPSVIPRAAHLEVLMRMCGSQLERDWLTFLEQHNLRLPSRSQVLLAECSTRPDFIYDEQRVTVYVDGPPHQYPERKARDQAQTECLDDHGYTVVRFAETNGWAGVIDRFKNVFGVGNPAI